MIVIDKKTIIQMLALVVNYMYQRFKLLTILMAETNLHTEKGFMMELFFALMISTIFKEESPAVKRPLFSIVVVFDRNINLITFCNYQPPHPISR